MRTRAELYKFHCENLRQVSRGIARVELAARRAIATNDDLTLFALIRLHALLLGTCAECRLKKLLYEASGFSDDDQLQIRAIDNQHQRWMAAVERAFRKRFKLPHAAISATTIPFTAAARYAECQRLLEDELRPVIELRNKFAHGQWAYLLNNSEDDVSTAQIAAFKNENLLTLQLKRALIDDLARVINDLIVSVAFDRDFDTHYKRIAHTSMRLKRQDYSDYVNRLLDRHARGKAIHRTAPPTAPS